MDTPQRKISGSGCLLLLLPSPLVAAPEPAVDHVNDFINSVNTVAVKVPEPWKSRVRGWFAQMEAQFTTKGISASLTKYYYVVKALNKSCIKCIPYLMTPPAEDPYKVLKNKLIELYDLDNFEWAELLPHGPAPTAGDMRPSQLMDWMRATEELEQPSILF